MSDSVLISGKGLTKTYALGKRTVQVLRGVDLDVRRGEFLALRGASGAGKSTLLHLLGGLDTPDAGEIWIGGKDLAKFPARALADFRNQKVGFIFQAYHILPELDALENVCVPARMARMDAAKAEERGRALLKRVGLEHRMDHRPFELSGGEQQRVAVARALVMKPALLLADEPTGDLDEPTAATLHHLLREMHAEHGLTSIIATHNLQLAAACDRVLRLEHGRLTAG